ncbi:MAG: MiaB/RimO family radical SAM methylthiotransferase [Gemmatimonadetes bacterium]|nr:MiaB/RimO family radical SAM methylthiotransferase [Gemmatimonadota bacterium]
MRVWLRTYGCRANQADTEQLRGALVARGATLVSEARDADVAVFNSCAVTAEAEADLRQGVRRAARERAGLASVVMGCAAALDRGTIATLPGVSAVVAGGNVAGVLAALDLPAKPAGRGLAAGAQSGVRALLRIQDGCAEHCTFCATTMARGAHRSRDAGAVVAEAASLAAWHPEVVITGTHVGHYGRETGTTLGALVARLVREVPGVRFRLTSVEATEVDPELAALLRHDSMRVAPHLHAPLQSGSDAVLRRMGRHWYRAASYARAVEALVRHAPVFALGADVIAGFPGETEADHRETVGLLEALPFTYLHVFPYSARPGTAATRLGAPVEPAEAARRAAELRAIGERKAAAWAAVRAGGRADVVVTGTGRSCTGLTEDYLTVSFADPAPRRGMRVAARLAPGAGGRLEAVTDAPGMPVAAMTAEAMPAPDSVPAPA